LGGKLWIARKDKKYNPINKIIMFQIFYLNKT
jgi:hypothetical protein